MRAKRNRLNFAQPGHEFDKVARAMAAIELMHQNLIPTILYRAI
jgi:hypothetical protein